MRILIINPMGVDIYDPLIEQAVVPAVSPDTKIEVRSLAGTGVPPHGLPSGGFAVHEPAAVEGRGGGTGRLRCGCHRLRRRSGIGGRQGLG